VNETAALCTARNKAKWADDKRPVNNKPIKWSHNHQNAVMEHQINEFTSAVPILRLVKRWKMHSLFVLEQVVTVAKQPNNPI
jgi:hypothetical protein